MARIAVQGAVCRQLLDVIAMAVEPQRQPTGLCSQFRKLLQHPVVAGVLQGLDAPWAQRRFSCNAMPLPPQHLPGRQQRTTRFGKDRELQRLLVFAC